MSVSVWHTDGGCTDGTVHAVEETFPNCDLHIKRQRKKAEHIGGSLQLFFGIKGKRWESEGYKGGPNDYSTLFNEYGVYPNMNERPVSIQEVEKLKCNCY